MRWLPLALMTGCAADRAEWESVPIESAWLDRFNLTRFDLVVGVAEGDALLGFDGPEGGGTIPVHLGGGGAGLVFDLSVDVEGHDGSVVIDLSDVKDPTVADVFGTYSGTGASAAAVIGGSGRRLKNGRGASFREDHFVLGIGLFAGVEWLVLREGGNDGDVTPTTTPTGLPDDTGGAGGTGDTSDTGSPPAPAPGPTPARGCGCGGRRGDGGPGTDGTGDTGATTGNTTPTTTGTTGGTTPTGDGGDDGDGGGSSCDCGSDGGCACSQGTFAPLGLLWAGVLIRRRTRRPA